MVLFGALYSFWAFLYLWNLIIKKNKKFKTDLLTSFILLLCTINENHMMYGSWDMERSRPNRIFCHFWHFLPFYSTNNSKNQNLKKWKNIQGQIIILHKSTKNHDHMTYCSWDIAREGWNCYISFWATFTLSTPPLPT